MLAVLVSLGFLVMMSRLTPEAEAGLGTHTQFGLPDCEFQMATGYPCPTCGYTTAASLAASGDVVSAFVVQPAAASFALVIGMGAWVGLYVVITGNVRPWRMMVRHLSLRSAAVGLMVVVAAGWGYRVVQSIAW